MADGRYLEKMKNHYISAPFLMIKHHMTCLQTRLSLTWFALMLLNLYFGNMNRLFKPNMQYIQILRLSKLLQQFQQNFAQ